MIREQLEQEKLSFLSPYATKDEDAVRFFPYEEDEIRSSFFRDTDRILYSLAYTRYIDKTQVFSFNENDHITKRMIHVQMVSKIARTIGRALHLNEDLIEAAALGHDLGHVPFGHVGERILNEISLREKEGYFNHNIESVRVEMFIENFGKGNNLTLQVLDAIMCHNGELPKDCYFPKKKTKEEFLKEYELSYKEKNFVKTLVPMTLEGCVVRISDIIAYVGKDFEDAKMLRLVKKEDIPKKVLKTLGNDNRTIVNTIVNDIIKNSLGKNYIKMSSDVYDALLTLKKFNTENIYEKANTESDIAYYKEMFETLYKTYLKDLENKNENSPIYKFYYLNMDASYKKGTSNKRIVIDYLAGMTDTFMQKSYDLLKKEFK